jgi:hypothetical protein
MENQYMVNWDNLVLNKLVGCKEPDCMMGLSYMIADSSVASNLGLYMMELDYTMELSCMMELNYMTVNSLEWLCMIDPNIPVGYCTGLHKMAVVEVEVVVHKLELLERKFVGHRFVGHTLVLVHRILHSRILPLHMIVWSSALEQRLLFVNNKLLIFFFSILF